MMTVGFQYESCEERRVTANIGLAISLIYAVLILLVYYAQTTSVRLEDLNEQTIRILDYKHGGLLFNYDLLGYGMMALSTFFIGLSIIPKSKADNCLKYLMIVHGVFFITCFIMVFFAIGRIIQYKVIGIYSSYDDDKIGSMVWVASVGFVLSLVLQWLNDKQLVFSYVKEDEQDCFRFC